MDEATRMGKHFGGSAVEAEWHEKPGRLVAIYVGGELVRKIEDSPTEATKMTHPILYIFDKDWTIVQPRQGKFINTIEDQVLMPGVAEKIADLKAAGHKIAIASNQGGVAFGFMTYPEAHAILYHAADLINADLYTFCPFHPEGTIERWKSNTLDRKPGPGMLSELMGLLDFKPDDVVFVGDMETDQQAAEAAGVEFVWAEKFFDR